MESNEERLTFKSVVYNRKDSDQIIDRSFQEFGQPADTGSLSTSIDQFFMDYEDLFFSIPILGVTGSHQYLAERSGQITKLGSEDTVSTDIEPLISEITQLRSQSVVDQQTILELNQQIAELNLAISQSGS